MKDCMEDRVMMKDTSGELRRVDEFERALHVVEKTIVRDMAKIPPELAIELVVIREGLQELIGLRKSSGAMHEEFRRLAD